METQKHRRIHSRPTRTPEQIGYAGLMTVREAATFLQLGECTVYQLASLGQLPSVKIGKARRFRLADVEAFIKANVQAA
jgi:excisionase family DNA binding protein